MHLKYLFLWLWRLQSVHTWSKKSDEKNVRSKSFKSSNNYHHRIVKQALHIPIAIVRSNRNIQEYWWFAIAATHSNCVINSDDLMNFTRNLLSLHINIFIQSTVNYTDLICSNDWLFTAQPIAKSAPKRNTSKTINVTLWMLLSNDPTKTHFVCERNEFSVRVQSFQTCELSLLLIIISCANIW